MARHASLIALAGLVCVLAAGCGDDAGPAKTSVKPAKPAAPPNLERFLLQNDEIPGFNRIESPRVDSSAESFAGPTGGLEKLRSAGFVSSTFQPILGDNGNAGVTNVTLFETEAGAREWMAFETSDEAIARQLPGVKIKRFKVHDVPGAHGFTSPDRHGNPMGHVYWIQGRCMMLIGNEGKGPFRKPLAAGAKAIYERTNGECPE